ncbi:MAG: molybdate ABC transporter substrate-binding protein [Acidimicrobiales bacterium]
MKRVAVLVALVVSAAGCSSSSSSSSSTAPQTSTTAAPLPINVFAAASLTGAFNAAAPPNVHFNFGGSNALVTQIVDGAPADVFASADQKNMQKLVTAGLVDPPVVFVRNKLEIAVAPGNPKHIVGLADLAKPDISSVLEAVGVPAGDYTRQVEASLAITITPKSLDPDVKTAIARVTAGEVDATVVYATDVRAAGAHVTGVEIPDNRQPTIAYPIAVVRATAHRAAAEAFVRSTVSGDVQLALEAAGFIKP